MSLRVEIVGRPAPKGSMIAAKTKDGRPYTRPASKHETPWINAVRDETRNAMRHHTQDEPPYGVDLIFRLARPAHPSQTWPTRHDLDKLVRSVVDGLVKGGAMQDDRHVVQLTASKEYVEPGENAGVVAFVYRATVPQDSAVQRAA